MPDFNVPGGEGAQLYTFDQMGSLNTRLKRPMIKDEQFSYVMNWMPIGPGNLRTLYAEGNNLYSASKDIIYFFPFNFGAVSYHAVFYNDGTADQIRQSDGAVTAISAVANTFYQAGVSLGLPAAAQYQSKFLVIGGTVTKNGYFIWHGGQLFMAGGLSPDVTVTASGNSYTSAPTVTAYGGSGSGATFLATVTNGAVTSVDVLTPGTGYLLNEVVQLAFTGGGSDTSARATASVATTGGVADIQITNGGTKYDTTSLVSFSGGGGTGAQAVITGLNNGVVTEISVTNPGSGYTSAPTVAVSAGGGGGSGFAGLVDLRRGQVSAITVSAGGSGYTSNPQIIISAPDADAFPVVQAKAIATIAAGAVSAITVTEEGLGYILPPTITIIGGNNAATAKASLMPFGVSGDAIETYQNSVWIADGTVNIVASAPGSTTDFATSSGGVAIIQSNSFLREKVVALKQTSGFLYIFNDSSIDVISNVQTSGTPASTTFNNSNVDSQVGAAWRDTVQPFGRALVFANSSGVYALYGGAAEKVSGDGLDGLFEKATFNTGATGGVTPTASVATIFGIRVYMLLFTTVDPFTATQSNILALWDGQRWFLATQVQIPTFIALQEINSTLTAWATDDRKLFPMFQLASTDLVKTFQTKLRGEPAHIITKQVDRSWVNAWNNGGVPETFNLGIDTEVADGVLTPVSIAATGSVMSANALPEASYGRFIGYTGQTTALDMEVLQLSLLSADYSPDV